LVRVKRLTDIKQAAMQINPARKTSQRSCCSVRQAYMRVIVDPSLVRMMVLAPNAGSRKSI
jgi:hypothetical protein